MGKASRWFRTFLGMKQSDPKSNPNPKQYKDKQRKCTFVKSSSSLRPPPASPSPPSNDYDLPTSSSYVYGGADGGDDVYIQAIAVVEASANVIREEREFDELHCAAILIQSYFRGYLARRALRALKGLVKLQALVRGHIMRKKTTETIRCMQAMLRAQARAMSVRAYIPESPYASTIKSCPITHPGPPTPKKFEQVVRGKSIQHNHSPKIKRNSSKSSTRLNTTSQDRTNFCSSWSNPRMEYSPVWDSWGATSSTRTSHTEDDRGGETLKTDTGKPLRRTRRSLFEASHSGLLASDNNFYCRPENSQPYRSPVSQGGRSLLSGYSDCPSYMAYTESSKTKFRSVSAPKQRPQFEKKNSTINCSVHEVGEHYARSNAQRVSSMHASFASKAYPGSGRLGRVGMPLKDSTIVYYSGYLN